MSDLVTDEEVEAYLQKEHDLTREGDNDPHWDVYLCGTPDGMVDVETADGIRVTTKMALETVVSRIAHRLWEEGALAMVGEHAPDIKKLITDGIEAANPYKEEL